MARVIDMARDERSALSPEDLSLEALSMITTIKASKSRFVSAWLVSFWLLCTASAAASELTWQQWGQVSGTKAWTFAPAHLWGDGACDAAAYDPNTGNIRVAVSKLIGGQRQFELTTSWLQTPLAPKDNWTIISGEFSTEGDSDLFAYHPSDGSIWVLRNTGNGQFTPQRWGTVAPAAGWRFVKGDFTGDGRLDIAAYFSGDGTVFVGVNSAGPPGGTRRFVFAQNPWVTLSPASGWTLAAGDFTRDGRIDIAGYQSANGGVFVHANTGSAFSFSTTAWASLGTGHNSVQLLADGFAGDSNTDLGIYDPSNPANDATFSVGHNASNRFVVHPWAPLAPKSGWSVGACDFTHTGRPDVLAYHPSDHSLFVGQNLSAPAGYAWPLSATPLQVIQVMTSGVFKSPVNIYRYTDTEEKVASINVPTSIVQPYPVPPPSSNGDRPPPQFPNGVGWKSTFQITVLLNWKSGLYAAKLEPKAAGAPPFYVTFVVKPIQPATLTDRIAVVANVNTWNAYNNWNAYADNGGKYLGTFATSFLRPNPAASPVDENDGHLVRVERYVLGWLTRIGKEYDLYTDIDFHNGAVTAQRYKKLLLNTHPEYWTREMRDRLDEFLEDGGSLIYLGGNGIFETVKYEGTDVTKVIYLNGIDADTATAGKKRAQYTFRAGGAPNACSQSNRTEHEVSVLGIASGPCLKRTHPDPAAYSGRPYFRQPGNHPIFATIFAGSGVTAAGHQFGGTGHATPNGVFNGAASGHEIDVIADPDIFQILSCSSNPPDPIPQVCPFTAPTPPTLVHLAKGCTGTGCLGADMTYYRHAGGGFVFSVGSVLFGRSLAYQPPGGAETAIQRIIKNVLDLQ